MYWSLSNPQPNQPLHLLTMDRFVEPWYNYSGDNIPHEQQDKLMAFREESALKTQQAKDSMELISRKEGGRFEDTRGPLFAPDDVIDDPSFGAVALKKYSGGNKLLPRSDEVSVPRFQPLTPVTENFEHMTKETPKKETLEPEHRVIYGLPVKHIKFTSDAFMWFVIFVIIFVVIAALLIFAVSDTSRKTIR